MIVAAYKGAVQALGEMGKEWGGCRASRVRGRVGSLDNNVAPSVE